MTAIEATPGEPKAASIDQKLVRHMARALFRSEQPQPFHTMPREERAAVWTEKQPEYLKRARKLHRILGTEGVAVTLTESAAA